MKYSKLPHVVAVGLLSLVLSACGDSSDSEVTTTPAPVQAAPTTVETTEEATEQTTEATTEESTEPAQTTETVEETTSEDATDSSAEVTTDSTTGDDSSSDLSGSVSFGGEWSVTIDGAPVEFPNAIVGCSDTADMTAIVVASSDISASEAVSIYLSQDEEPTVKAIGLVKADGTALSYAEESPIGSATATKDGDTYTVTGEALMVNANDPSSFETAPFEVVVTCK